MIRRTFALLLAAVTLAACTGQPGFVGGYPGGRPLGPARQVAILLPLTGPRANLAGELRNAAELALAAPGSPGLDVRDTAGSPAGAARAAQAAIAAGDGIILGPLTSAETAAVAPLARRAGIPVLAFTNDPGQSQPGVWPLGITPRQQVRRLVAAAQAQGKSRFAALVPDNDLGRAMAQALQEATENAQLAPPRIQQYGSGMASLTQATRDISDYEARGGGDLDARIREARERDDPEGRQEAADLGRQRDQLSPPPFDVLLLADTGEPLSELASLLPYFDIRPADVRILGPALWDSASSGSRQFPGAWYAAPDPAARAAFRDAYSAQYGAAPPAIADLAYDAASLARLVGGNAGPGMMLTQPAGFAGANGLLALDPDGGVRRALAVFEIQRGGPEMIEQAPPSLAVPGV